MFARVLNAELARLPVLFDDCVFLFEDGIVEWTQAGVLAIGAVGLFALAYQSSKRRGLYLLLSTFVLFILVRELNYLEIHRSYLADRWFKPVIYTGILVSIATLYGRGLWAEFVALLGRPSIPLFLLGTSLVLCCAQILGQQTMWTSFYGDRQIIGKRLLEESLELIGYLLVAFGILEEYLDLRRQVAAATSIPGETVPFQSRSEASDRQQAA